MIAIPETIYVYLSDEGTDVWAPIDAEHIGPDLYRIIGLRGEDKMKFKVGDTVRCRREHLSDGEYPVVCEKVAASKK